MCYAPELRWSVPPCREYIAWDPNYHGSTMMVPVVFVTWLMAVLVIVLGSFVVVSLATTRRDSQSRASLIKP